MLTFKEMFIESSMHIKGIDPSARLTKTANSVREIHSKCLQDNKTIIMKKHTNKKWVVKKKTVKKHKKELKW